jgi:hypothetical protein
MDNGYGSLETFYGCRAWVNFSGTGTPTRRGFGNVSSITDNNTGDYTVNFTSAMPDSNYATVCSAGGSDSASEEFIAFTPSGSAVIGSVKVRVSAGTGSATDVDLISVAIFR